jgi:hypothetical protein
MTAAPGHCGYCGLPMEECRRLTDLRQHLKDEAAAAESAWLRREAKRKSASSP